MEATERLVRTWMASGRDDELAKTVSDVSSGHSTLLNVVKALGEYLTSEEDLLRTKGVDFLSQVIERCPPERINRQATRVLVTFYSGKLEDPETIIPALKGLVPLTALPTFSGVDAVETVKALFSHVVIKDLNQSTRYLVFKTLDSLMALHRDALKGMGNEFLTGYTSLVDGEKDPRNLMLAFSIDRVICIEFDISRHVEELFNVIFCYFPITFKPPADDPYGITPEDLKQTLRSCLNSSPLFGQLAIPLFLDKLLAGSPSTKKDIIVTMASCIPVYGASVARTFAKKLWNSLKLEVFQPVNTEIEGAALKSTQVLIQTIYGTETKESSDKLEGLVKEICEECLELMGEPEKSQAVPASKVIAALVGTTPDITRFALSQAIPRLMKLFRDPGELVHRPQILTLLCVVVGAVDTNQTILVDDYGLQAQLLSFKDDILGAFISGTKAPTSLEAGLEGLRKLSQMQDVLTEEELVYVVHNINEILQTNGEEAGDASDDALDVLITIADKHSKVVEESTLPLLFTSLPDSPPARDAHADRAKYWRTLRWLARLCVSAPLFETLVVRLSTKLDLVCAPKTSCGEAQDTETRTAYAHSILRTLTSVLELKVNARHSDVPKYIDRLVPRLYNLFIYLSSAETSYGFIVTDSRLLSVAGQVITLVVQTIPIERQKKLALDLRSAFFEGNVAPLAVGHQVIPIDIVFKPFETSSSSLQRNTVSLLTAAVIAFHKEVLLPEIELNEFLSSVQLWSLRDADNDFQQRTACHLVASILNRNTDGVALFISSQLETVWKNDIADTAKPSEQRRQTIESWLWIAKALVVLNHEAVFKFVDRLFELFEDSEIGWDAARTVGKIASGGDTVLTKQNHAVIRILYAQRYFKAVLPKVMEGLKGPVQMPRQKASLVALTSLITSLPKTTYISDVPTLMPYLIRGLDLPDIGIRINIINTLSAVADSGGQGPTQEHANTLVSVMLKNALPQELTSVSLRVAALKYLAMLPGVVRYDILHPHKASVIRELEKSLDDAKRAVRKEAVGARTSWFLYQG